MTIRTITHICDYLDKIREDTIAIEHRLDSLLENNKYESYELTKTLKEHHKLSDKDITICELLRYLGYTVGINENHKHIIFKRED